jgi:putative ABC transport system permease protein
MTMWSWRKRSDEDFAEEIQAHISHEVKRLVEEEGMNFKEAKVKAIRSFGNIAQSQERFYESKRVMWLESLRRDVTYALRSFWRNKSFASIAIITLALGIGANAAIFSVVNGVLLKPLPYLAPDRLLRFTEITPASATPNGRERRSGAISVAELLELRSRAKTVTHVSFSGGPVLMTFSGRGASMRLEGQRVAPGIFKTLGVEPFLGSGFGTGEEEPGNDTTVVLSFGAWQRHFGGDPNVIGQTWTLANTLAPKPEPRLHTIVGVMPEGFEFPDRQIEFWVPAPWRPTTAGPLIARLADGVSAAMALGEIATILRELRKSKPEVSYEIVRASRSGAIDDLKPALLVLMVAAGFVLLIACANVGNLLFARATVRQREMAVRSALGARRGRLIRQLLTESIVLAFLGGLLGIGLAIGGVQVLKALAMTMARMDLGVQLAFPRLDAITIDSTVLIFVVVASISAGIVLGVVPALRQSRPQQMIALRESVRGRSGHLLVTAEISLAMILLVGAGLLLHSFMRLSYVDPGYDPRNVLTFQVALPSERYSRPQVSAFADTLIERLRSIPGVQAAAHGQLPMVALTESAMFRRTPEVPKPFPANGVERRLVSSDYLTVMGIRIVAGRGLTDRDRAGQPRALLINQVLADREFPGENPIGQLVYASSDSTPWEIIGVVANVRQGGLDQQPGAQVFAEYSQWPGDVVFVLGPYFSVRTQTNPLSIVGHVREVTRQIDPQGGLFNVATMEQLVSNRLTRPRMYAVLLGIFAAVAVLLAVIGIYGVMAHSVTSRTREIGVRMALGAQKSEVVTHVLRQSALSIGVGLALGLAGATAMTKYLEGMLFGVTPLDGLTFVAVSVLFLAVALFAAFLPSQRAAKINPVLALRYE